MPISRSYAFYALDKALRAAGSAIAESAYPADRGVLGCKLNAAAFFPARRRFPRIFNGIPDRYDRQSASRAGAHRQNQSDSAASDVLVS